MANNTSATSNYPKFEAFENLDINKVQEVQKFVEGLPTDQITELLKWSGMSEGDINALLESLPHGESTEVVVGKTKSKMSNTLRASAGVTLFVIVAFLLSLSGGTTNSTQEVAPDKIEEVKPDVKGVEVVEKTYTVEAENVVETVEGGNEATVEEIEKTEEVANEDEIDLDALNIDANDLVVVKTALENANTAVKEADQAKKEADQAKKEADQAKKEAEEVKFAFGHKKDK